MQSPIIYLLENENALITNRSEKVKNVAFLAQEDESILAKKFFNYRLLWILFYLQILFFTFFPVIS